jgi:S-adenosylmethionine:tRNA ribosyltransferase-isomerase
MIQNFASVCNLFDRAAMSGRLSDYDYDLPPDLIAQRPLQRREDSRMMVLHRAEQTIAHYQFR